ncbi:uncharacterized protein LTR77_008121 [Saxophila tyrrhenica]|uniref:gluconokinase n=1 Tax=Saxophila tyrrhenica TaxID=1690608 RepID=A0AAV9P1X4_9PEZI|nr:hypothetical protein LTR77_008121 [Saxophila tyrrhenica]
MATAVDHIPAARPSKEPIETAVEVSISRTDSPQEDLEKATPRTIDELIRLRAHQSGHDQPIVSYPEQGTAYVDYTPRQLDELVERAAVHYSTLIRQRVTSDDPVQVVGILGQSDLSYLISFLAISRLGHSALLLSTRITEEAHESLLSSTQATALLYHDQFTAVATAVVAQLPNVQAAPICNATSLPAGARLQPALLEPRRETEHISFIIHSSGSTGLPKPIYQTHRASLYTYSQNFGLVGFITLPLYHNHGICCLFRAIHSRRNIYIYNARLPLASQNLLSTLQGHPEVAILYGVPYALKLLAESTEGLAALARLDIVMFGGSACPKPIGDKLVENGVNLVGHYGATEVGQLMTSFRDHQQDKQWDWLRVPPHFKPYLSMELRGPNLYELVVTEGWPSKVATNRDDGSYATKDLFEPHPTLEDAWRYYARLDDTIVLENGEKANPLLVEGVLRENPHVAEAVVFGANKPRLGAFIVPATTTDLEDAAIIDAVMPAILNMNASVPAYSHLTRDMIRTLPRDAEYRRTDKGTVIRAAFYKSYASQIDDMYADEQSGSLRLSREKLLEMLRSEFLKRVPSGMAIKDDTDLFSLGVDSLQAIQVRSFIIKNLAVDAKNIGRNFVFDFPTVEQMTNEILRLQTGQPAMEKLGVEDRMRNMIQKYSNFSQHVPVEKTIVGKHIVVTGSTGSLGAHVVAKLASQRSVRTVYCLVRASSIRSAEARVRRSLQERRLYHELTLSQRSKIVAWPADFGKDNLGLSVQQYDQLLSHVSHVLHLAWSVNFNKALESFESDCIAGARNLMDLCLKTKTSHPAAFNFCSSVSATARTPGPTVPEALPESLSYAQGMGYAQSKLVTEHLCYIAASETGLQARVLRVGQIIGDTRHGVWNDTEAIPMIFQTAKTVGCLPTLDESPAWLPVDQVANACIEIACSGAPAGCMNIVNHEAFHWTRDLLPLLRLALDFEEVGQREWIRRLRASSPNPQQNPPIKLVDFFASKYDNDSARKSLTHATELARAYSPTLQNAGVVDEQLMRKIIVHLKTRWWTGPEVVAPPTAIIVGGPCGSGKTTVAQALCETFSIPFIEGDMLHSRQAREKMRQHVPLDDIDRLSWLAHLRGAVMDRLLTTRAPAVVVTCSALRSAYRDELRTLEEVAGIKTLFVMLQTDRNGELKARMAKREGHYMDPVMVDAQVSLLEEAKQYEVDVLSIDAAREPRAVRDEVEGLIKEAIPLL